MKTIIALTILGLVIMAGACKESATTKVDNAKPDSSKPAVNRSAEEAAIRAADIAWSDAAGRKDADAVAGFMTADGQTLPPNAPAAKGTDAVKKGWADIFALKDAAVKWEPAQVQVADSGDLGYTNGTYTLSFTDPKGAKVEDHGKYLEVWKKVDGKWKCHLDMYSSDLPTAK